MIDLRHLRSILFVPGDSARKLERAVDMAADAILIDWEDAVADANKPKARSLTAQALQAFRQAAMPAFVRINPLEGQWGIEDCQALQACMAGAVVIPKCDTPQTVAAVARACPQAGALIPLIESPSGVLNIAGIAALPAVPALMFGAEDYSAAARIQRSEDERELAFARGSVVNAARAMRKEVIDSPLMNYSDPAAVRRAARRGRRLGFTGQAAIHPAQVPIINEAYSPSEREIAAARAVLERYADHGGGVYGVGGVMEDLPAVREARAVLARCERSA